MPKPITIFTDGGARGNPGPAGAGIVIYLEKKENLFKKFLGEKRTNNEAEYEALILALKKVKLLVGKEVAKKSHLICYSDSELMVRQLNHQYKIKEPTIQKLFLEIWNLMLDFSQVEFLHIPREKNSLADKLANQALDEFQNSPKLF